MSANRLFGPFVSRPPRGIGTTVPLLFALLTAAPLAAQTYPAPRLTTLTPPGGKVGTKVEMTVNGGDLDDAKELYFSHPSLKATRMPEPKPKVDPKDKKKPPKKTGPGPIRFEVTIPADAPVGIHDVRVIGKWGISNPRAFVVGERNEVREKENNNDVDVAQKVEMNCVVNGVIINKTDVDYFAFPGKKGQKVVLHCAASSIDSRLNAFVQLFSESGRELGGNKHYRERDAVLSVVLPADGVYLARVCEFAYQNGGPESFYRLAITDGPWIDAVYPAVVEAGKSSVVSLFGKNLPGGKPEPAARGLERLEVKLASPKAENLLDFPSRLLPRMGSVDGFGYRLQGPGGRSNPAFLMIAEDPLVVDNGENEAPETAQEVKLPCTVSGRIEKRGDRDYYVFDAKKGETVFIESFGDRLRAPVDLYFQLKRQGEDKVIGVFDDHPALPTSLSRFFTHSDDARAKFTVPEDGRYELLVRSRTSDFRGGPRHVYKVAVRRPRPDFRLVLVGNHDSGAGLTLRQGSSHDLNVVCFRQDDFEGEIELTVEGLPSGVSCAPQVIGPKLKSTVLVLTASPGAADWAGEIRIQGTAVIDGEKVTRQARGGCLVYPTPNNNVIAVSRLSRSICVAVRDKGPFRLETPIKEMAVPAGGPTVFKIKLARQMPDYKDNAQVIAAAGPPQPNGNIINFPKLTLGPDKQGEMKVTIPNNVPPGTYNVVFRGTGKLNRVIDKKKKANLTFTAVTTPIRLTVFTSAGKLVLAEQISVKPGGEALLPIKLQRLHGYKGEYKVELVAPSGAKGISAAAVTIPPGATEGKLIVKAAKGLKPGTTPNFLVRATAKFDKLSLKEEAKLKVAVSPDAKTAAPGKSKTTELVAAGSDGWRYLPAASVKGNAWRGLKFDDGKWRAGRTPLGNGEGEIQTRKGTEVPEKGVSLYCRRIVEIPPDMLKNKDAVFQLRVASDNSATVYLNGKMVDDEKSDHEFSYWNREVAVPASVLLPGRNAIAVEVHNSTGSSDVYLDLALEANVPEPKKK